MKSIARIPLFIGLLLVAGAHPSLAAGTTPAAPAPDQAYLQVITTRAEKIVAGLGIEDAARAVRVRDIIARQFRNLRDLHDARDAAIAVTREALAADKDELASAVQELRDEAELKQWRQHAAFVGALGAELTPEQVDRVKDGLTYGVVPLTYRRYLELHPTLTGEQKVQIHAWLLEAREHAMDGGSSDEKHGWFGKYKGRINNYLSAAGYDAKAAEKALEQRQRKP